MIFLDEAQLLVRGGRGGNGCVAFRREKYVPKGGPSGGDGGHGGSVVLVGDHRLNTLYHLQFQSIYAADRGRHGMGSNRSGKTAEDLEVTVPLGTVVEDAASGERLGEILAEGERLVVAKEAAAAGATSTSPRPRTRRRARRFPARRAKSAGCGSSCACSPTSGWSACPTPASRP